VGGPGEAKENGDASVSARIETSILLEESQNEAIICWRLFGWAGISMAAGRDGMNGMCPRASYGKVCTLYVGSCEPLKGGQVL
jgi:hypothetical protein